MNFLKGLTFFPLCGSCYRCAIYFTNERSEERRNNPAVQMEGGILVRVRPGILGLLVAGLGLIVLGVAALMMLSARRTEDALSPTDFSAIPAAVRYAAPALSLDDLHGTHHALSDYVGQVVVVNLWATWCPPCQAEMPILQTFFEKHRREGLNLIAIEDGDPTADVESFVAQIG